MGCFMELMREVVRYKIEDKEKGKEKWRMDTGMGPLFHSGLKLNFSTANSELEKEESMVFIPAIGRLFQPIQLTSRWQWKYLLTI